MWTYVVGGKDGLAQSIIDMVMAVVQDAAEYWGRYINFGTGTLDIKVNFAPLGDTTLAQAGPTFFFQETGPGGADVFQAGPILELQSGIDPNGGIEDIEIDINSDTIRSGEFFLGGLDNPNVPFSEFDLFTVLVHEIGHGLGFLSFDGDPNGDLAVYDLFVEQTGPNFFFTGANAVAVFGGDVPLDTGPSHISLSIEDVLNASLANGQRLFVSALDIAMLADIDLPILAPTENDDVLYGFHDDFDTIDYIGGDDSVSLLGGNDWYDGLSGADTVNGGDGDDYILGGLDDDSLSGGAGNDTLDSGEGFDRLFGGAGDDLLIIYNQIEINGGSGFDTVSLERLAAGGQNIDITLANLTSIEMVIAGDGDDTIHANGFDIIVDGAAGDDLLSGESGSDTLIGGAGADTLNGGADTDTASYETASSGVSASLSAGGGSGGDASGDVFSSIENLAGSAFSDTLTGNATPNGISGLGGADLLDGGGGADTISGGAGDDTLNGGSGDDTIGGEAGRDFIAGGDGADTLHGFGSHDSLYGGNNDDDLRGGFGRDLLNGSSGNDTLRGFEGDDRLFGGGGSDTLLGNDGNDSLTGGGGVDRLKGDAGEDTLNGRFGDDLVTGGAGDDLFEFRQSHGSDTYDDFVAGAGTDDAIELIAFGTAFDTFAEVIAAASDNGNHTTIDFGGGDSILLLNVTVADLHEDDFIFS